MNLIMGLIQSLYSPRFYRQVIQSSISKGLLYLTLWAAIFSMLASMVISLRFLPEANHFMTWFRTDMPVLEWRPEGLKMDRPSPYEMKHPRYGHVVTFDMNQTEITSEKMGDSWGYVTATKLYVRKNEKGQLDVRDLTNPDLKAKEPVVINAETVQKFERMIKPWIMVAVAVGTFFTFFIWKLMAALFYSFIASLINLFRSSRLNYESLLNVSCFALTASIWINVLQIFVGGVSMPFGFLGSLIITTTYLYLGIKFTEDPEPPIYTS